MDSIADLLSQRLPDEPPEIRAVKDYIRQQFNEAAGVAVRDRTIVITVRSSSLAASLRMRTAALREQLGGSDKQLVFRIGRTGTSGG